MSSEPKPGRPKGVAAAFENLITRAVARVTVGLGIVALVLSESHTSTNYTSTWGIVRWAGFVLVVLSLPPLVYYTYLRYQRRRRDERAGSRSLPNRHTANEHQASKEKL
jgi:hypothetical protein